jgi:hypothetical protein
MTFDICRYQVRCLCGTEIDLPRQSPLGKFPDLENPPMGEWPATFLCSSCEQAFSCSYADVLDVVQIRYPGQLVPGLLRTEYADAHESSGERSVIYTPCSNVMAQQHEIDRVCKYLSKAEGGEILRQDTFPFE